MRSRVECNTPLVTESTARTVFVGRAVPFDRGPLREVALEEDHSLHEEPDREHRLVRVWKNNTRTPERSVPNKPPFSRYGRTGDEFRRPARCLDDLAPIIQHEVVTIRQADKPLRAELLKPSKALPEQPDVPRQPIDGARHVRVRADARPGDRADERDARLGELLEAERGAREKVGDLLAACSVIARGEGEQRGLPKRVSARARRTG